MCCVFSQKLEFVWRQGGNGDLGRRQSGVSGVNHHCTEQSARSLTHVQSGGGQVRLEVCACLYSVSVKPCPPHNITRTAYQPVLVCWYAVRVKHNIYAHVKKIYLSADYHPPPPEGVIVIQLIFRFLGVIFDGDLTILRVPHPQ